MNHTVARFVFLCLFFVAVLLHWKFGLPIYFFFILIFIRLLILIYGSYFIRANYFTKSLCRGSKEKKAIALTFDDGPKAEFTPQVLDILKIHETPAAFFIIGRNIAGHESLLKRMVDEGHIIGNHSYSHNFWFSLKSRWAMVADLKKCNEKIFEATGKKVKLFRPPYGVTNPMVAYAIKAGNYISIGWSLRTYDTTAKDKDKLLGKTLKKLKNGDIVLLHDWGRHTITILPELIKGIREKGFEIVRMDKLSGVAPYYDL